MKLLPKKTLIYWYRAFRHQFSGWTPEQQIQFHQYAIDQLKQPEKGGAE